MGTINQRPLHAYVRFDGSQRIVAGSLILRRKMPKVGKWQEIEGYLCCNPTTSTTTTTSTTLNPENCYTYTFVNLRGASSLTYTNCNGDVVGPTEYNEATAFTFCSNGDISYTGTSASVTYESEGCTSPCAVLGEASRFAVLGASTVTNTGTSVVIGDLGLSPGTSITGFPPGVLVGTQHLTDATAAAAQVDAQAAFDCLHALAPATRLSADIGGTTVYPGVYDFASSAAITGVLTLNGNGDPNNYFVFIIPSTLTTATSSSVVLANSAQAGNVYWIVGTSATIGISTTMIGTIIADQSITMNTSATLTGKALALVAAVTLDTNVVTTEEACTINPCTDTTTSTTTTTTTTAAPTTTTTSSTTTTTTTG